MLAQNMITCTLQVLYQLSESPFDLVMETILQWNCVKLFAGACAQPPYLFLLSILNTMMAIVIAIASTTNIVKTITMASTSTWTPPEACADVVLEASDTLHTLQVGTPGLLQLVEKGLTANDAPDSPLCNSPEMTTSATTLKWYTPLGTRSAMSPEVVVGGKA